MSSLILGLDVGGTFIKSALLSTAGKVIDEREIPSHARDGSPEGVRAAIRDAYDHYKKDSLLPDAIGVGCAGSVNPHLGLVVNSPNFQDWKNVPLRDWLSEDFGLPVHLENDANCAVMAEWKLGAAKGSRNVVLLTLGTGIGGGLIVDNKIFNGSTGTAGELGHFSIDPMGFPCACGNQGCFERYCSASALEKRCPGSSVPEIFERAAKGEEPFASVFEEFLIKLKVSLVSLSNLFDPDTIVLAGGVAQGLRPHLPQLREWIASHAFPMVAERVQVLEAEMGHYSGAIGAALFACNVPATRASSKPTNRCDFDSLTQGTTPS